MAHVEIPAGTEFNLDKWYFGNACPSHITGRAGALFRNLIHTLLISQCAISSPCSYPDDFGPYVNQDSGCMQFDFIIVGGGTAGCILANRLTEIGTWSVLLIEAGGDPPMSADVPSSYMTQQLSCIDWQFKTEKEEGLYLGKFGQINFWPAGKVLGGSSTIGRMMYTRGTREDYDQWENLGNTGWDYLNLLQYFKKAEYFRDRAVMNCSELNIFHGTGGYVTLESFGSNAFLIDQIKQAASALTFDDIVDQAGPSNVGFLSVHATVKDGERMGMAKSYLATARDRPNLFVIKNAMVTKILFSGKRAVGVEYRWRNETKPRTIMVKREVIVSAGTINSAKLLLLSGIGPANQLNRFGIPVISDLRVGCNLQDHPAFPGAIITLNKTSVAGSLLEDYDAAYEYLSRRSGPLANIQESEVIGYIGLHDDEKPDVQIFTLFIAKQDFTKFNMFASAENLNPDVRDMYISYLKDFDLLIMIPILLRPHSRGVVQLRSCDPMDPPIIISSTLRESIDVDHMLSGIQFVNQMSESIILRRLEAELRRLKLPGCCHEEFRSDTYWICSMAHLATSFHDYAGTNKMGPPTDNTAVVDPELRVYGVTGLRVIDASIVPVIPSGNMMATTVVIAEKGADIIKNNWLAESGNQYQQQQQQQQQQQASTTNPTSSNTSPGDKKAPIVTEIPKKTTLKG